MAMIIQSQQEHLKLLRSVLAAIKADFGLLLRWGVEKEFYIIDDGGNPVKNCNGHTFYAERGAGQHEFKTAVHGDIAPLLTEVEHLTQSVLQWSGSRSFRVDFSPKPFTEDYGSALHINMSLHDSNGANVLGNGIQGNDIALHAISGIMMVTNPAFYLLVRGKEMELHRFVPKFMAPVNISWGFNNRTTLLRIPDSGYENRRLEFRLPSAEANIIDVLLVISVGILHGLRAKSHAPAPIYGNAQDYQQCVPLPHSLKLARESFYFYEMLEKLQIL